MGANIPSTSISMPTHIVVSSWVRNESRKVAAQFLLDSIDITDNFRHSVLLLSCNEVCEIIVHLGNS